MTPAPLRLFNSLTRQLEEFQPVHPGEARVYSCGPTVYNYAHIGNMRAYVCADVLGRTLSFKGYRLTHVINITDVGHLTDDADGGEDKLEQAAKANAQSIWDIAAHYTQAYWTDIAALNIRQPAQWSIATQYVPQMIAFAERIAGTHCYELAGGLYFDVSTVADYGRLSTADHTKALSAVAAATEASLQSAKMAYKAIRYTAQSSPESGARESAQAAASALDAVKFAAKSAMRSITNGDFIKAKEGAAATAAAASAVAAVGVSLGLVELSAVLNLAATAESFGRIESVEGKRHPEDFAIWRKTPPGETRAMEWDSPWGRGAPGWHLECSVMSQELLGFPFDIHTGGIDHREIHHPNEIAQNQAFCGCGSLDVAAHSGARVWMHNNFLVERSGKMSKSSGDFLRLQLLIDRGYHPLAYRLMCLQAHYRSELEFSWDGLGAALTRLKRVVMTVAQLTASAAPAAVPGPRFAGLLARFDAAISDDLNTPVALTVLDEVLAMKKVDAGEKLAAVAAIDAVLGLDLLALTRAALRIRPASATIAEPEIAAVLTARRDARAAKDFAASDGLRDRLAAQGVEVMDGDPLGWEWRTG